jgi:hypothetical protein
MKRTEAIEFIKKSLANYFTYGDADLGMEIEKAEAIKDIENMTDDEWNDGTVHELLPYVVELHYKGTSFTNTVEVLAISEDMAVDAGYGMTGKYGLPDYVEVV